VSSDDLKAGIFAVELRADVEGDEGGGVSCEEILVSGFEFPAFDLF
jgi:hypothetical protein